MSRMDQYEVLSRYNRWMNERLYAAARRLSDEQRKRDLRAFFGSLHGTLNHLLLADRVWMLRFTGDRDRFVSRDASGEPIRVSGLAHVLYEDFEELTRQRAETDAHIEAWVSDLTEDSLDGTLSYATMAGAKSEHPLWWALLHMFNHQTHHRGQVTTLLTQLGVDPGATDLLVLLKQS